VVDEVPSQEATEALREPGARWRAAVLSGLAEGEELAEVQRLDADGQRLLQEECITRRVEQLVAELPGAPSLVEAKPAGSDPALVVIEARPESPGHPKGSEP
jgi:hypothetical protein